MSDNTSGSQGGTPYGQQNQPQYGQNDGSGQQQAASPYGQQNQPQYGQNDGSGQQQAASPYGQQAQSPYGERGQSPYGQSGGNNYPGQQGYDGQSAQNPGRTLGIVGFILAILVAPVGLVISIVAFVKSRKAKMGNGFALAGIIIGALFTIIGAILIAVLISFTAEFAQQIIEACQGQPAGTPVTISGQPTTCP